MLSDSHDALSDYLSGVPVKRRISGPSSVWSRAREASKRLSVIWEFEHDKRFSINYADLNITDRRKVFHGLRSCLRNAASDRLKNKKHQGKTAHSYARSKASSHFIHSGDFIRFTDRNFIHRARLGLVDLNGYNRDAAEHEKLCRRCGSRSETLPHVLNNCHWNLQSITERHNSIVDRVKVASSKRWKVLRENQTVAGSSLKPDLVLVNENSAIILDVAVTFENGPEAFSNIRKHKLEKYAEIAETLRNRYKDVAVAPIILGSLGSWDPLNDRILLRLCTNKYLKLMRKLIVSDTIRYSRDIFFEHVTGKKQSQPSRYRRKHIKSSLPLPPDSSQPTSVEITISQNSSERSIELIHAPPQAAPASSLSDSEDEIPEEINVHVEVHPEHRDVSISRVKVFEPVIVTLDNINSRKHVIVSDSETLQKLDSISSSPQTQDFLGIPPPPGALPCASSTHDATSMNEETFSATQAEVVSTTPTFNSKELLLTGCQSPS